MEAVPQSRISVRCISLTSREKGNKRPKEVNTRTLRLAVKMSAGALSGLRRGSGPK